MFKSIQQFFQIFACWKVDKLNKKETSPETLIIIHLKVYFSTDFFCGNLALVSCQVFIPSLWSSKANHPQSPPSLLQDSSIHNNARLISILFLLPCFDPNEWCMINGLHSGGLNPRPLSHESSALTTRPWLLAFIFQLIDIYLSITQFKMTYNLQPYI